MIRAIDLGSNASQDELQQTASPNATSVSNASPAAASTGSRRVFNIQFAFGETDPATLEEEKASAVELSAAEKERAEAEETLEILERLICERKERLHQLMVALGELALTHADSNLRAKA